MRARFTSAVIAAGLTMLSAAASATPIGPGGSVAASPVTVGSLSEIASITNVAFTSQAPAGVASTFNGTYTTGVYRDSNNALCAISGQCLTFIIQVNNSASSTDAIETVTTGPFSSAFTYNVGYNSTNNGKAPIVINDSATGTMQFDFRNVGAGNIIMPGMSSSYLVIQTSATNYAAGSVSFQDNQTATVAGFIPAVGVITSSVPEPASWALMIGGFGMIGGSLRRRAKTTVRFA